MKSHVSVMPPPGATFAKLDRDAATREWEGIEIRIPSALHLVALKLHAIRQPNRRSREQDGTDVIELIRICDLEVESEQFRSIAERYGDAECFKAIQRRLGS